MGEKMYLYPFLDPFLAEEKFTCNLEVSYFSSEEKKIMELKSLDDFKNSNMKSFNVLDPNKELNLDQNNIFISLFLETKNIDFLFGKEGFAPNESEIGFGLRWVCKKNSVQGAKKGITFKKSDLINNVKLDLKFSPGSIKESLVLELVLFIETPAKINNEEFFLGNEKGMLIGLISKYELTFEGKGSYFPLSEQSKPGYPLWWTELNWNDIFVDPLEEEFFRVVLNTSHKESIEIEKLNSGENNILLREIVSETFLLLFLKAKDEILDGNIEKANEDTIAFFIHYLLSIFEIDINLDPDIMSRKIKAGVEERIQL